MRKVFGPALGLLVLLALPELALATPFSDTFDSARDVDPGYGLNDHLAARQTGPQAGLTYRRARGAGPSGVAVQPWLSQVNHPSYPGYLSFWNESTAVRLDAALVADTSGALSVEFSTDPHVGSAAGADWSSFALSNNSLSTGSPLGADVALGLLVQSNGVVRVYQFGQLRAQWTFPATTTYTVSAGINFKTTSLSLTVNGAVVTTNLASGGHPVNYAFLGAGFSASGSVTTFGSFQASRVFDFADNFESANVNVDYGLHSALSQRQAPFFRDTWYAGTDTYLRRSGLWNTSAPPTHDRSQVNRPAYPGKLAFQFSASAVTFAAPLAPAIEPVLLRATIDPVVGSQATGDWSSIGLCQTASCDAWPTNADNEFALTLRDNGGFTAYQHGVALLTGFVSPAPEYDVELSITSATTLQIGINGVWTAVTLNSALAALCYPFLGVEFSNSTRVTTFDDLAVSRTAEYWALERFGYWSVQGHVEEVVGHSNFNMLMENTASDFAACDPASCMTYFGWDLFPTQASPLSPTSSTRVDAHLANIASYSNRLLASYVFDEPYARGVTSGDFQLGVTIVETHAMLPSLAVLDPNHIDNHVVISQSLDWIGVDRYCVSQSANESDIAYLESNSPADHLFLVSESTDLLCGNDASIAARQLEYLEIARRHPRIHGLMTFGLWKPSDRTASDLPVTADMLERVGNKILNR